MKKAFLGFLSALFVLCPLFTVYAADTMYDIPELNLKVPIPSGWTIITKDTSPDNPLFGQLGLNGADQIQGMKDGNIYLEALITNPVTEIAVSMVDTFQGYDMKSIHDFNHCDDAFLNNVGQYVLQSNIDSMTYKNYTIYRQNQATFLLFNFEMQTSGKTAFGQDYTTFINNQCINYLVISIQTPLTDNQKNTLKAVVDGSAFTNVSTKPTPTPTPYSVVTATNIFGSLSYYFEKYAVYIVPVLFLAIVGIILLVQGKKRKSHKERKKASMEFDAAAAAFDLAIPGRGGKGATGDNNLSSML